MPTTDASSGEAQICYIDASALERPQKLQGPFLILLAVLVVIGVIIGIRAALTVFDATIYANERAQERVEQILAGDANAVAPALTDLMLMSDDEIVSYISDNGYNAFDLTAATDSSEEVLDWIILPASTDKTLVSSYYVKGIAALTGEQAATALKGAWRLTVERSDVTSMRIRYADFTSKSASAVIQNAITSQQLDGSEMGDSGVDDSGNTYATGTITTDYGTYSWRVSTCPLDEVYDVTGLPSDAYYVSIRLTA